MITRSSIGAFAACLVACALTAGAQTAPRIDVAASDRHVFGAIRLNGRTEKDRPFALLIRFDVGGQTPAAQVVAPLQAAPEAIVADGDEVITITADWVAPSPGFPNPPLGSTRVSAWKVLARGERWALGAPPPRLIGSLPAREVRGAAVWKGRLLVALGSDLVTGDRGARPIDLVVRHGRDWLPIEAPSVAPIAEVVALAATPGSIAVLTASRGTKDLWIGDIEVERRPGPPTPARIAGEPTPPAGFNAVWRHIALPDRNVFAVAGAGGTLILASHDGEGVTLWTRAAGQTSPGWRRLASITDAPTGVRVVGSHTQDRAALVWTLPLRSAADSPRLRAAVVSLATGRVLADEEIGVDGPVASSDYRFIAIVLLYMAGITLLLTLRPRDGAALNLPNGYSLAEPGRRLVAGTIDLVFGLAIAALILRRPPMEVLTLGALDLLTEPEGQTLLLAWLGVCVAGGTITEWLTGRTPGKALCSCNVVRVDTPADRAARPSLRAAFLRNLVKWCLPPAGLVAVWAPAGRHRGEEYSRTCVVVADDPDDESAGPD
ncbi:MAG TPA: RDD family protein [Phycisphaerales bacterium]|nr:RDD family protein [Phycisphaerales bacterium]